MPDEEIVLKIKWKPNSYQINNISVTGGTIQIKEAANYESTVNFEIEADTGYKYDGMIITNEENQVLLTLTKEETRFKMPLGNIKITPKWSKIPYTISKVDGTGGTITIASSATIGENVSFTSKPDAGYAYDGAIISANGETITTLTSGQPSFSMPATNIVITSKWVLLPMMKSYKSLSTEDYHNSTYKDKTTSIITKTNTMIPTTALASWDVSASGNGSVIAYAENDGAGGYRITIGGQGGIAANTDCRYLFQDFKNVVTIDLKDLNTSNVTSMERMFQFCNKLANLNIRNFDTSKVADMNTMFSGCSSLTSLDLTSFNTINVKDMQSMFYYCKNLKTILVSNKWTMANVTSSTSGMYTNCPGRPQVV